MAEAQLKKSKPRPAKTPALGLRIRDARCAVGMTQEELGSRCGVSPEAVSKWEQGFHVPQWVKMRKVAEALQAPFMDLVQEEKLP